jgi:hypothetical protein
MVVMVREAVDTHHKHLTASTLHY